MLPGVRILYPETSPWRWNRQRVPKYWHEDGPGSVTKRRHEYGNYGFFRNLGMNMELAVFRNAGVNMELAVF